MSTDEACQSLCNRFLATGLYLRRKGPGEYTIEPKALAKQHKALVDEFRQHRDAIIALLEAHVATDLFTNEPEVDICPHCNQQIIWLDVEAVKRRAKHHVQGSNDAWCAGGDATTLATAPAQQGSLV